MSIESEFAKRGFTPENTGGGCMAYAKYFESGEYIYVTCPDGEFPTELSDALYFGRYGDDGYEIDSLMMDSVAEFFASAGDWWDDAA